MIRSNIQKVLNVWESKNKITQPAKKELYFEVIGQMINLFSADSFYYYIFDFEKLEIEMAHQNVKKVLGIEPEKFTVKKLLGLVHSEDIKKLPALEQKAADFFYRIILQEDILSYKVVYVMRLRDINGIYKTILHQAKALLLSNDGKIQKLLCIHTDISYLNIQKDYLISFISHKRPSYYSMEAENEFRLLKNSCKELFTPRETEIIRKIAEGKDFHIIADELYLSPHTVNTHKKNILHKSGCNNITELVAKCVREGVI